MSTMNPLITTLKHSASGSVCEIHALGATVLSFKDGQHGQERLFLSKTAVLDGSKPIRGGIPLVFPIFGPPTTKSGDTMPQHGFARRNLWTLVTTNDQPDAAHATYTLDFPQAVCDASLGENNDWTKAQAATDGLSCRLEYQIRLTASELTTALIVHNTGTDRFSFQCLQHTYLAVPDVAQAKITGLGGYGIQDKLDASAPTGAVQSYDEAIGFKGPVDRVYVHPQDKCVAHVTVNDTVELEASGMVQETPSAVSCVVWNPGHLHGMSDLDSAQQFVCVEPGLLGHQPILSPNQSARLTQTLRVV